MKVLVLGASGMIGSAMYRILSEQKDWEVWGAMRSSTIVSRFPEALAGRLIQGGDFLETDSLIRILAGHRFDVVVNCAGLTKHRPEGNDAYLAIAMNALFPHRLSQLCRGFGTRLIHVSTDCVFSGETGGYTEASASDAPDVYGKSKFLGEVHDEGVITLRTSTIGHEFQTRFGLLEWFLTQQSCKGYSNAIFSGLPSVVFARVVRDIVIPQTHLTGLYHMGAGAINKLDLLERIARIYGKQVTVIPDAAVRIDRSLDSSRFNTATGYVAPEWQELLEVMHENYIRNGF
jgi:dTDP-4-dehydrorhamnose reductase